MGYEYPTKTIELPVSGLTAVIREANAHAEDLLFARKDEIHKALPDYWAYCTVRLGENEKVTREHILGLLQPDQHFLAIEIHRVTFGDKLILSGADTGAHEVDLGALDVIPLPDGVEGPDPIFTAVLPRTGHKVEYGYLTGRDELDELEIEGFNPTRQVFKAIRTVDGAAGIKLGDVLRWPLADHKALRAAMRRNVCGYDPRVRFTLPNGKKEVINLLADPSFLLPGLAGLAE